MLRRGCWKLKKTIFLILFIAMMLAGCGSKEDKRIIAYNAVMKYYGTAESDYFKKTFLDKNRVRGSYLNENYDPSNSDSEKYLYDSESPEEIIIVINSIEKFNEIFNHKFEVDFEKEILILRLFSATNCSYSLSEVKIDNNVLQIIYKRVVNVTTVPQRTAILIKMDKIEYEKIEFMCDVSYKNSRGKIK